MVTRQGSIESSLDALRDRQTHGQDSYGNAWRTQGEPRDKRHIKSTYASASPVDRWPSSSSRGLDRKGRSAFDMNGKLRWKVDLGRVDMGAYDIPAYEWGPASSPIIWNGLVIVQCDTQTDSS